MEVAGCKYAVALGFLVRDAFLERAGRAGSDAPDAPLTREPTILCVSVRAVCVSVRARARTRAVAGCSKYLVSPGLSSSRRLRVSPREEVESALHRFPASGQFDHVDRAGCAQSAGKIMIRVVVCLAPAIAVEGFLGFLNTLNIAVAEVT